MRATKTLLIGVVVFIGSDVSTRALWRRRPLQELRRVGCRAIIAGRAPLAWRPLGRISADLGLQLDDIYEHVGLATQLVRNHRRLRCYGRDDGYANPSALYGFDKRTEIAVTREKDHVIDRARDFHGIDREFDIHVSFDFSPASLIHKFLGRLGDNRIAVVVEPVDQRTDGRIFLILDDCRVIKSTQQITARLKLAQEPLVIDIKPEGLCCRVKIRTVNEQSELFARYCHFFYLTIHTTDVWTCRAQCGTFRVRGFGSPLTERRGAFD